MNMNLFFVRFAVVAILFTLGFAATGCKTVPGPRVVEVHAPIGNTGTHVGPDRPFERRQSVLNPSPWDTGNVLRVVNALEGGRLVSVEGAIVIHPGAYTQVALSRLLVSSNSRTAVVTLYVFERSRTGVETLVKTLTLSLDAGSVRSSREYVYEVVQDPRSGEFRAVRPRY